MRRLPAALVGLVLGAALYFPGLGTLPFYDKGEPREALSLAAQTRTGDWILPLTGGSTVPSKPPLLRWLSGIVVARTGRLDEWAARVPSAALATLTIVAVGATAGARFGPVAGVMTVLVLATSWTWIGAARVARVDMTLTACLTAALLALERVCRAPAPSVPALLVLYLSAALAVLAKGPVGMAIPALVGLAYLLLRGDLRRLLRMRLVLGAVVVLAVAGSWYAAAAWQGGEAFVDRQLRHENLARFLGGSQRAGHRHPAYFYGPAFVMGFMPWTLLLVPALAHLVSLRGRLDERGLLFPLVWFCGVIGFYSLAAGKRSIYVLSAYPAAALLVGALFDPTLQGRAAFARTAVVFRAVVWVLLVTLVGGAAGMVIAGAGLANRLPSWVHAQDRRGLALVAALAQHDPLSTMLITAALAAVFGATLIGLRRQWPVWVGVTIALFAGTVALGLQIVVQPRLAATRTLKEFAAIVDARVPRSAELRFVGPPNGSLRFYLYLDREVAVAERPVYQASSPQRCRYVLVWKRRWRTMRPESRAMLQPLLKSAGRGPEGNDRLLLARARSTACASGA